MQGMVQEHPNLWVLQGTFWGLDKLQKKVPKILDITKSKKGAFKICFL